MNKARGLDRAVDNLLSFDRVNPRHWVICMIGFFLTYPFLRVKGLNNRIAHWFLRPERLGECGWYSLTPKDMDNFTPVLILENGVTRRIRT